MDIPSEPCPVVDVAFALDGTILPREFRFAMWREIVRHIPWIENEDGVGIHPIRAARANDGSVLLARRARLIVRIARDRVADVTRLSGAQLDFGALALRVGAMSVRPLLPFGTLYAYLVATDTSDELEFLQQVEARLAELGTPCKLICGKRAAIAAADRQVSGFSLMACDLAAEDSLRLQRAGLGPARNLGCGILVPHRSAAAVHA